ncbi:hypothetical protein [Planococcus lenghuensis]|uniref:Uncharacterized protein n=1 Tax=Planococcus lenghuensis TaxID=2213202 RepID=A0A1Q2L4S7_9BACL|nr:hypothetical protein [Planococcus lenghuensis]AQQ55423.1 hypothetical protein B0X71_19855 [Planococcus lenghuensis]
MKLEDIKVLLRTIVQYDTVNITQTFTKTEEDRVIVRCLPNTKTIELTFIPTQTVEYHESIDKAAQVIAEQIN